MIKCRWYVLHAYSGYEKKVADSILDQASKLGISDNIEEVSVPTQNIVEVKRGVRINTERKIFPGYILVQMEMDDDSWFVVRNTPGVTGFVSAEDESDNRPKPVPLEQDEVDHILNQIQSDEPRIKVGFASGQTVRVTEGPFIDFMGVVDEVYPDRLKVKVLVSFFGRETPVELDFLQVEKT